MNHLFEACTGNLQSVREALRGGAERIELCAALPLGGLTPSLGMVRAVREMAPRLTVHLLVRPREGNFVYSEDEVQVMVHDIAEALPYVDGIVCGALLPDGDIDLAAMVRLVEASKDKPVTFHRAFDECRSPFIALQQIIDLGCRRLLTSGQQPTAFEGIPLLRQLCGSCVNLPLTSSSSCLVVASTRTMHGKFLNRQVPWRFTAQPLAAQVSPRVRRWRGFSVLWISNRFRFRSTFLSFLTSDSLVFYL